MFKASLVSVLVFLFAKPLFAQTVDTSWVRRYNGQGNGNDVACAVAVDASGNVYVAGTSYDSVTSNDYATIKYYPNGDTAWVRRYNGPGNSSDGASAMALDPSGYIYVTGTSGTVKYDAQGNQLWVDSLQGSDIAIDTSGNIYVARGGGTQKYDPQGNLLWTNSSAGSVIAVDIYGNAYKAASGGGYTTTKLYPDGDTAWVRLTSGSVWGMAADIGVDASGNVYVTGSCRIDYDGRKEDNIGTVKYDADGNQEWFSAYRNYWGAWGVAIVTDDLGNAHVAGYLTHAGHGSYPNHYVVIKYGPNGDSFWSRRYYESADQTHSSEAHAICIDRFDNVYVTGMSNDTSSISGEDYATLKYTPEGGNPWVVRFSGPGVYTDKAQAIAVDGRGNVYVTGGSYVNGSSYDFATIKYWQNYPPDSFSLVSPSDSAVLPYVVTFDWDTTTDPDPWDTTRYDLYVSTSPNFHPDSTVIFNDLLLNQQTDTLEIGKYYWKVRAYDKHSETWSNQIWTFRVQNYPPNAFSLLSPFDSVMIPYIVAFDWETATDPDPWDTAKYDLYVSTSSIFSPDSTAIYDSLVTSQYTDTLGLGRHYWKVRAYDSRLQTWSSQTWTLLSAVHGDANADKKVTVADVVYLVNFLFKSGPAPYPFQVGDVNCDGYVTVSDVVYLINYLFKGGPIPCEPQ